MSFDRFALHSPRILEASPELAMYRRWMAEDRGSPKQRDYLFADPRVRFEPHNEDVLVALPGLSVEPRGGNARLRSVNPPAVLDISGVDTPESRRILAAIDGANTLVEARLASGVAADRFRAFLGATFGLVVFAPDAVTTLDRRVPGVEVTRYPGSPYVIGRPFWSNMVDACTYYDAHGGEAASVDAFIQHIRELHVLILMGRSLNSYYRPASPGAEKSVSPGAPYFDAPQLLQTATGTLFLRGPRVNVSLLGGEAYHRCLYSSIGDEAALAVPREFAVDGLSWGRVVTTRAGRDQRFADWFCPPRPMHRGHWEHMFDSLRAAERAVAHRDTTEVIRHAASFHWSFVRLHPFSCANQSLAMNVVNALLRRCLPGGIPHLLLDHFALRTELPAYRRVFERAVHAFTVESAEPSQRLAELMRRAFRSFAFIERLKSSASAADSDQIIQNDREAARWALVVD